jgi:hypothetical protein
VKTALAIVGGLVLVGLAVLAIGGWLFYRGLSSNPGSSSLASSFHEAFDKSFRQSCQSEAVKKGASQDLAEKYCECALVKFKETKSMEQATNTCAAQFK